MAATAREARQRARRRLAVTAPRSETRVFPWVAITVLASLTLGLALGRSGRLTYHEAIEGQVAREMLAAGDWLVPTLGGRPWLEKPPLAYWSIAALGWLVGGVDEVVARVPGALAGWLTALAVLSLATRRFGGRIGLLAGLVQVSMVWLVTRARLAEPDGPLACLVAWSMVAFDRVRSGEVEARGWRGVFFALLGATAMLKGVGFGGALIAATVGLTLAWDRDRASLRALVWPTGWLLAAGIALTWPAAVVARYPEAVGLWVSHVTDRLALRPTTFAGEPWWQYAPAPLVGMLPWTPLVLGGAWRSWGRARLASGRFKADRLLWAWTVAPSLLVSLASARNAHYLIHAFPPGAVWAALGLARLGERLRNRGWSSAGTRKAAFAMFALVGLAWGLGYAGLGPWLDRRGKGAEWAFYEEVGRTLRPGEPVVLLYDALDRPDRWDRLPYPTPFGPVPPDLAARLFSLDRPEVVWVFGFDALDDWAQDRGADGFAVVARERDRGKLGQTEVVARGPTRRWDRAFVMYRVQGGISRRGHPRFISTAR